VDNYFDLIANQLFNNLAQIKVFIKKHNPTIGILTEEIIREFLSDHLPNYVSVEQGFIINAENKVSKQCDILIYDSLNYSPLYRIKDIVVIPEASVLAVIEVKTTITKQIFHNVIDYFKEISKITTAEKYLFIYNSKEIHTIDSYFKNYRHVGDYQDFDHDTFQYLPDCITGLSSSYHLGKDLLPFNGDYFGYTSLAYKGIEGTEINALQHFYESISNLVSSYISERQQSDKVESESLLDLDRPIRKRELLHIKGIELFPM
jgi:hypothetical protein